MFNVARGYTQRYTCCDVVLYAVASLTKDKFMPATWHHLRGHLVSEVDGRIRSVREPFNWPGTETVLENYV